MKKVFAILTLTLLFSCGKEYQCECIWEEGPLDGKETVVESESKISEKKAIKWCEEDINEEVAQTRGECELL